MTAGNPGNQKKLWGGGRIEIIYLNERDAGRLILSPHNCCIVTGRKRGQNRRFAIVSGRDAGRADRRLLRRAPIVVGNDQFAIRAMKFEDRILERPRIPY